MHAWAKRKAERLKAEAMMMREKMASSPLTPILIKAGD